MSQGYIYVVNDNIFDEEGALRIIYIPIDNKNMIELLNTRFKVENMTVSYTSNKYEYFYFECEDVFKFKKYLFEEISVIFCGVNNNNIIRHINDLSNDTDHVSVSGNVFTRHEQKYYHECFSEHLYDDIYKDTHKHDNWDTDIIFSKDLYWEECLPKEDDEEDEDEEEEEDEEGDEKLKEIRQKKKYIREEYDKQKEQIKERMNEKIKYISKHDEITSGKIQKPYVGDVSFEKTSDKISKYAKDRKLKIRTNKGYIDYDAFVNDNAYIVYYPLYNGKNILIISMIHYCVEKVNKEYEQIYTEKQEIYEQKQEQVKILEDEVQKIQKNYEYHVKHLEKLNNSIKETCEEINKIREESEEIKKYNEKRLTSKK